MYDTSEFKICPARERSNGPQTISSGWAHNMVNLYGVQIAENQLVHVRHFPPHLVDFRR